MTDDFKLSKADYIIQQLNVETAKKACFLLAFSFIIYHSIIHFKYGNDSCKWLLQDLGRFKGDKEWQPNESSNNNLEFIDSRLKLRVTYVSAGDLKTMLAEFEKLLKDVDPPNFIIASSKFINLSFQPDKSENFTKELEKSFVKNLTLLVTPIDSLVSKQTRILWKLQDPIDDSLNEPPLEWKDITNSDIEHYNRIISDTMKYSNVNIWRSGTQIAYGLIEEMKDGFKLGPIALKHDIQILLNMYCNDNMNYNDGTCCSTSENYTMLQIITYSIFLVCLTVMLALFLKKLISKLRGQTLYMPLQQEINQPPISSVNRIQDFIQALGILGIIMVYFYLCDRTNFFMKENKYYSEFSFWIPVCWMTAVGLFFTEDSKFTRVMHRDQTDEMKGFMIIVVLIYYMTGATRVIPIYMIIKVFISTFLFLIGYQHFSYFWQTGNNGITRFLNVMFRINFMTIVLCFAMNRPYQFYFFAPLVSFWFGMTYLTFTLPPRITAQTIENNSYQYLYLVIKFICLLSVITILYMSEVFFERIFLMRPWRALFVSMDDFVDEWWYRFKLDRYSTAYGMMFAAIFIAAQKFNIVDDSNHGNLFSRRISLTSTLLSIAGLGFYTTFTFLCKNKLDCEEIHSYVVFIPIISFLVLRNISGVLRTRFSTLFAWFGKISLELFICMHHIWLAADRHGVLVLLPGFPTLNIILTSFIFVCISHEIHRITQILVSFAVPQHDWRLAVKNLILFMVVLIPIGRSDGMI
ncbi:CLUMA_CG020436, isoform A [Clunio marinus]|uniref:CLUMA_CG020436, isoform A n=1 Tax=Clunio marinus TaxID=568069 RepID=A0A1J1J6Q5_9DIPT|nr:CLUMA_CG020436, isoform A [Clunio marinus]